MSTQNIEGAINRFRKGVLEADAKTLDDLLNEHLSYGHSDGHVEGKREFIGKVGDGTYSFVTMDLGNQNVIEHGDVAVVRHELDAETNDEGKPGEAHLYVLLVWQKYNGNWQLIARQAVKKLKGF